MKAFDELSHAVAHFYEKHGPSFAQTRRNYWGVMKLVADRVQSGQTLLDIGAGNARLASFLTKDISYIAIEPSASLCDEARRVIETRGEGIVKQGGFPSLPALDEEADTVACLAVLHHLPGREAHIKAIKELYRILKPGGSLVLTVWNLRSRRFFHVRTWLASWLRLPLVKGGECGDVWMPWKADGAIAPRYVHAFSLRELRSLFGKEWDIKLCSPWGLSTPANIFNAVNLVIIAIKKTHK